MPSYAARAIYGLLLSFPEWVVWSGVFVFFAVTNALLSPLGNGFIFSQQPEWMAYAMLGFLLIQPCVLAVNLMLGREQWVFRFPCFLFCFSLVVLAASHARWNLYAPPDDASELNGGFLTMTLLLCLSVIIAVFALAWSGRRLELHRSAEEPPMTGRRQYRIAHLLGATTIVGLLAMLLRFAGQTMTISYSGPADLTEMAVFWGFATAILLPSLAISAVALASRYPFMWILLGIVVAFMWSLLVGAIMAAAFSEEAGDILEMAVLLQFGAVVAGLVAALIIRSCGFRLCWRK